MTNEPTNPIVMESVTDAATVAAFRARQERFARNVAWLEAHAAEVFNRYRGKCICIAGEELFVGNTPEDALTQATAAHPEDDGRFVQYIYKDKVDRIYAHRRILAGL